MDNTGLIVFGVACLLAAFSLLLPVANRLRLPYTVVLAIFGMVIGYAFGLWSGGESEGGYVRRAIAGLQLPPNGFLFIFLPVLLFAAGLTIDVKRLMDELGSVILLAFVAVALCMAIVGVSLAAVTGMSLAACLLLGAIVATTDSAAVLAIFKDLGAPRRLLVLVEGESLFNDAAAIALYTVVFGVLVGINQSTAAESLWGFLIGLFGGMGVGYLLGRSFVILIGRMREVIMAEVTLSIALAYLTYFVADTYFGVSGVIAVVTAAMTFSSDARTRISRGGWGVLQGIWRMLDFWATSLIFILAAMLAPKAFAVFRLEDVWMVLTIFVATMIARGMALWGLMPVMSRIGWAAPVENNYKTVLAWGGLRGAVTIVLALAVAENPLVPEDVRRFVLVGATAYVMITLFLQAPTLQPLIKALGMDRLSASERRIRDKVMRLGRLRAREEVASLARNIMPDRVGKSEALPHQPEQEVEKDSFAALGSEDRISLSLMTVANREMELYYDYLQRGIASRRLIESVRAHTTRMLEGARSQGLEGYKTAAFSGLNLTPLMKLALWIQRRLHFSALLAEQLADRFEILLIKEVALRGLESFVKNEISAIVGPETADEVHEILQIRLEAVTSALNALELQFPSYSDQLRNRYLERIALGIESTLYLRNMNQSLISRDVYDDIQIDLKRRRNELEGRPDLDLGIKLTAWLQKVPLFQALDEVGLGKIARQLRPSLALPGEPVIRKGQKGRRMYFLASGCARVKRDGAEFQLEEGDFFGEMALLNAEPRNADVVAETYCNLLVLDRRDFRRVVKEVDELREAIKSTALERST